MGKYKSRATNDIGSKTMPYFGAVKLAILYNLEYMPENLIFKLGISISLVGLLAVGLLLALGHPGFAIRVTNYLYFVILASILWGFLEI